MLTLQKHTVLILCGIILLILLIHHVGNKNLFDGMRPRATDKGGQRKRSGTRPGDIPHIIHQTWMSTELPKRFSPWVKSWLTQNPTWEYWFWTDEDARRLIERHYRKYLPMYDGYKKNINRADAMRYFVLYKYGGLYADIDVECLKPLDAVVANHSCILAEEHRVHSYLLASRNPPPNVINTPMACRRGHPYFFDVIRTLPKTQHNLNILQQTGPHLIDNVLRTYLKNRTRASKYPVAVMTADVFNPMFDPLHVNIYKTKCAKRSQIVHLREVCDWLQSTNYTSGPSNSSYTNHLWIHTYMTSYQTDGRSANLATILRSLGANVIDKTSTQNGTIPRNKFGPLE